MPLTYSPRWLKCTVCGKGMKLHAESCEHCGREYSTEEWEILRQELRAMEWPGLILGVLLFSGMFLAAAVYLG